MADLSVSVIRGLTLRDPFMVASSHWTSGEASFRQLAIVQPAAITLKTTSAKKGGTGTAAAGSRDFRWMRDSFGNRFGRYTDGPKMRELWDVRTTAEMSYLAHNILPNSVLGLSVLQDEDYAAIASELPTYLYGYVELNWKYTFRNIPSGDRKTELRKITNDLNAFLAAFGHIPKLIKLPREADEFLGYPEFNDVLRRIGESESGLIVANSLRTPVPPSRVSGKNIKELDQGVVVGEHLYMGTYRLVRRLNSSETHPAPAPPIVASGGIVDMGGVVDILAEGAGAVQLCSAFDMWGIYALDWFREQLASLLAAKQPLGDFVQTIRSSDAARCDAARTARDYEMQIPRLVEAACNDPGVGEILVSALREECAGADLHNTDGPDVSSLDRTGCTFVVTYGNVSSFLIARRFGRRTSAPMVECESALTFVKRLADGAFNFDFAIIPKAAYDYAQTLASGTPIENRLHVVGAVGKSIMELVGEKGQILDSLSAVYHFAGTSAKGAVRALIEEQPSAEEILQEINAPQLVPLLRSWKDGHAILAKGPLSRLYGLVCPSGPRP